MKKRWVVLLFLIMATALTLSGVSLAEGGSPGECAVPGLDSEGAAVSISETEKAQLERLIELANPSDLLVSFDFGDDIDHVMWIAGFVAGYEWHFSDEAGSASDPFVANPNLGEAAKMHFSDLWAAYYDGWWPRDEANPPPANLLPYSMDGDISDAYYLRAENTFMQLLIRGIFGREMVAPETHIRYFDGHYYFGHISDLENRLWGGYDFTVDTVCDLLNGYYKIEGYADYYHYATGEFEERKTYEAIVKKDAAADYGYYLLAQRFGE